MVSIAMFNNKGGVGKTTLICNLASFLSLRKNKKVLVIDADPQCNTSKYVLDDEMFSEVYIDKAKFTVSDIIDPLTRGEGYVNDIKTIKSIQFGFSLLPGNPNLAVHEDFLSSDWSTINNPGTAVRAMRTNMVFMNLLNHACDEKYDYVFFDMGPSLGAINRTVLLACDYFITPMSSDIFSILALDNIGKLIMKWSSEYNEAWNRLDENNQKILSKVRNSCNIKFLGYVKQQYIAKQSKGEKRIVKAFEELVNKIPSEIEEKIVLRINNTIGNKVNYDIGSVPYFYSLIPMSQSAHKPIFNLMGNDGIVGAHYNKVREYENVVSDIVQRFTDNLEALK